MRQGKELEKFDAKLKRNVYFQYGHQDSHPLAVLRAAELNKYGNSNEYRAILEGKYEKRKSSPPVLAVTDLELLLYYLETMELPMSDPTQRLEAIVDAFTEHEVLDIFPDEFTMSQKDDASDENASNLKSQASKYLDNDEKILFFSELNMSFLGKGKAAIAFTPKKIIYVNAEEKSLCKYTEISGLDIEEGGIAVVKSPTLGQTMPIEVRDQDLAWLLHHILCRIVSQEIRTDPS